MLFPCVYAEVQILEIVIEQSENTISLSPLGENSPDTEESKFLMLSVLDVFRTVCHAYGMQETYSGEFSVTFKEPLTPPEEPMPYTLPKSIQRIKGGTVWIEWFGFDVFVNESSYTAQVSKIVDEAFDQVFGKINVHHVMMEALEQWE